MQDVMNLRIDTGRSSVYYPSLKPIVVQTSVNVNVELGIDPDSQDTLITITDIPGSADPIAIPVVTQPNISNERFLVFDNGVMSQVDGGVMRARFYTAGNGINIDTTTGIIAAAVPNAQLLGGVASNFAAISLDQSLQLNNNVLSVVTGNIYSVGSAKKLSQTFNLATSGDATGSVAIDGSANVNLALTLANTGVTAGSFNGLTVNAKGLITAASNMNYLTTATFNNHASTVLPLANNPTAASGSSLQYSREDHVHPTDLTRAPINNPIFTGQITISGGATLSNGGTSITPAIDDNSTNIATTAYYINQASNTLPAMATSARIGTSLRFARSDHVHPTDTSRAPVNNPTFIGTSTFDIINAGGVVTLSADGTALTVNNDASIGGVLNVTGAANLLGGGNFSGIFAGAHTYADLITLTQTGTALNVVNNATIGGTLNVTGITTLGVINAGGLLTLSGTGTALAVTHNATISGTLAVTGVSTLGVINAGGLLTLAGTGTALSVTNNASIGGNLSLTGNLAINQTTPVAKIDLVNSALAITAAAEVDHIFAKTTTGNGDVLRVFHYRLTAGGNDWSTAALRLQRRVDVIDMGFLELGAGNIRAGIGYGGQNTTPGLYVDSNNFAYAANRLSIGSNTIIGPGLYLNGSAAANKILVWQSVGLNRWQIYTSNDGGGANAGGDFVLSNFADNGTVLTNPVVINRASGLMTLSSGGLTIQGIIGSTALTLNNTTFGLGIGGLLTYSGTVNPLFSVTGSVTGTWTSGNANLNSISINSDTINATGTFVNGFNIIHNHGGGSHAGSRQGIVVQLVQTGPSTNAGTGYNAGFYVGGTFTSTVRYPDAGGTGLTSTTAHGRAFGFNPVVTAQAGALNYFSVSGGEINVEIDAGASAFIRSGLAIANLGGTMQGAGVDVAWWTYGSSGAGWRDLFLVGSPIGGWPMDNTNGAIFRIHPYAVGRGGTTKWGMDFNAGIFPATGNPYDGGLLRSNGISIDGAGTIQLGSTYISSGTTGLAIDAKGAVGNIADGAGAVASGGTGYTISTSDYDVAWDNYGGIYSLTNNASGVVTSIKVIRQPVYPNNNPPTTPLATTAYANIVGTGLTITPSWNTTANTLALQPSGGNISIGTSAVTLGGGIFGADGSFSALAPSTYGSFWTGAVGSFMANNAAAKPQVSGFATPSAVATYSGRDSVALYASNQDRPPLITITSGVSYDTTHLNLATYLTAMQIASIRIGAFIETNDSPKFTGTITAVAVDGSSITVSGWFQIGNTAAGQIPTGSTAYIDVMTSPFAANFVVLYTGAYTNGVGACGLEIDSLQHANFTLGNLYSTAGDFPSSSALQVVASGTGNQITGAGIIINGPFARGILVRSALQAGFIFGQNSGTGFLSGQTSGNAFELRDPTSGITGFSVTAPYTINLGKQSSVASVPIINFYSSGNTTTDAVLRVEGGNATVNNGFLRTISNAVQIFGSGGTSGDNISLSSGVVGYGGLIIVGSTGNANLSLKSRGTGVIVLSGNSVVGSFDAGIAHFYPAAVTGASQTNTFEFSSSLTGAPLTITAGGVDANAAISLYGRGTGAINLGSVSSPVNIVGTVIGTTTYSGTVITPTLSVSSQIILTGAAPAYIFNGGDAANIRSTDLTLRSFWGIGFSSGINNQTIPLGLNAAWLDARVGNVTFYGTGNFGGTLSINSAQISTSGNNTTINVSGRVAALTGGITGTLVSGGLASGGSGAVLNERFTDASGNIYTATAVDGTTAVTTITLNGTTPIFVGAPANPVTLTSVGGVAVGVTVNLTWTQATGLILNPAGNVTVTNGLTISGAGTALSVTNNATISGTLTLNNTTFNSTAIITGTVASWNVNNSDIINGFRFANTGNLLSIATNAPVTLITNNTTASGNNVLNFAATTGVVVGMYAYGSNFPIDNLVTGVTATTVTLAQNTTGAGVANGASIYFAVFSQQAYFYSNVGNASYLRAFDWRFGSASGWAGAAKRLQHRIDTSDMGFIEFSPSGFGSGVALGTGRIGASVYGLQMNNAGNIILPAAGIGLAVTNSATIGGNLTITGTLTAGPTTIITPGSGGIGILTVGAGATNHVVLTAALPGVAPGIAATGDSALNISAPINQQVKFGNTISVSGSISANIGGLTLNNGGTGQIISGSNYLQYLNSNFNATGTSSNVNSIQLHTIAGTDQIGQFRRIFTVHNEVHEFQRPDPADHRN